MGNNKKKYILYEGGIILNLQECFLELAQIEGEASELYKKFSLECSEKLIPVVISFSKEEENHKKFMLKLSNNINLKEEQLHDDVDVIFQNQANNLNANNENLNITSERDFFGFALQLEKDSVETYTKLLNVLEINSDEYKGFEALIKEERKHMLFILSELYKLD